MKMEIEVAKNFYNTANNSSSPELIEESYQVVDNNYSWTTNIPGPFSGLRAGFTRNW